MTSVSQFRLIVDRPYPGAVNMARDETLLIDAAESGVATLRFYQWSEPTLSLGYFQRVSDRYQHAASRDCAIVRRQTGGGAILHDRELTYSLALPTSHSLARTPANLYAAVHDALIGALGTWLDSAGRRWDLRRLNDDAHSAGQSQPFLCFQRRSCGDVVLIDTTGQLAMCRIEPSGEPHSTYKIIGSAQRRFCGAILQHGSVLLAQSPHAPELPGWLDLVGTCLPVDELASAFAASISRAQGQQPHPAPLPPDREYDARRLANTKYGSSVWLNRR